MRQSLREGGDRGLEVREEDGGGGKREGEKIVILKGAFGRQDLGICHFGSSWCLGRI